MFAAAILALEEIQEFQPKTIGIDLLTLRRQR
jgi:hypothetical protein